MTGGDVVAGWIKNGRRGLERSGMFSVDTCISVNQEPTHIESGGPCRDERLNLCLFRRGNDVGRKIKVAVPSSFHLSGIFLAKLKSEVDDGTPDGNGFGQSVGHSLDVSSNRLWSYLSSTRRIDNDQTVMSTETDLLTLHVPLHEKLGAN